MPEGTRPGNTNEYHVIPIGAKMHNGYQRRIGRGGMGCGAKIPGGEPGEH
jgi:hypothetical protein